MRLPQVGINLLKHRDCWDHLLIPNNLGILIFNIKVIQLFNTCFLKIVITNVHDFE